MHLPTVDLPDPDSPIRPKVSPLKISKEIELIAVMFFLYPTWNNFVTQTSHIGFAYAP